MVKRVKVGVSSDKIQTTRTTAWAGRERKKEDKSQRILKLLAGFIIGQGIMLAAAVVVLTIFLHSNKRVKKVTDDVILSITKTYPYNIYPLEPHFYRANLGNVSTKEIIILKQKSDMIQSQVNLHIINHSALPGPLPDTTFMEDIVERINTMEINLESDIQATTNQLHQLENNMTVTLQAHDIRIMQLEAETANLNESMQMTSFEYETKLTRQGANIAVINDTVHALMNTSTVLNRTEHSRITDNVDKLTQLEIDIATGQELATTFMLDLNASISKLAFQQKSNIVDIRELNASVTSLEQQRNMDTNDIDKLNKSVTYLEKEQAQVEVDLRILNLSIAYLKDCRLSDREIIASQSNNINSLYGNMTAHADAIYNHSVQLVNICDATEINRDSIQNLTSKLSIIDASRQKEIERNSKMLSQLDVTINKTLEIQENSDERLSYLEVSLNCTWGEWTPYSSCSTDGTQYRERTCESLNPDFTGMWCSRTEIDILSCKPGPALQVGFTVTNPVAAHGEGILAFSTIITNSDDDYSLSTGKFTCKHPGLYLFSMTLVRDSGFRDIFWCYFYLNDVDTGIEADAYGDDFGYPWATNIMVTYLAQGDTIHLYCHDMQYMCYATFSGVLIQPDSTN